MIEKQKGVGQILVTEKGVTHLTKRSEAKVLAQQLGISTEAARSRLRRGKLAVRPYRQTKVQKIAKLLRQLADTLETEL